MDLPRIEMISAPAGEVCDLESGVCAVPEENAGAAAPRMG